MRDASDERKGKEQCSCLPTRLLPVYCVFLLSIVSTTCQQVVFISIILFIWVCVISSPKSLTISLRLLAHTDTWSSLFKFQFDDDDDGHKTYTVWMRHASFMSYHWQESTYMWQLILNTLLRAAMKCLSWTVLYSFDFNVYVLKCFALNMFTDSIAKFIKYTL